MTCSLGILLLLATLSIYLNIYSCHAKLHHGYVNDQQHTQTGKCTLSIVVKNVSSSSISLHWTAANQFPHHCKEYDQMKVICNGDSNYISVIGDVVKSHKQRVHYYPIVASYGMLEKLEPNTKYNCVIFMSTIGKSKRFRTQQFVVKSQYGAPKPPQQPELKRNGDRTTINLYNTSTQNGPISGYEVQFHLMNGISMDDNNIPLLPEEAYRPYRGDLPTLQGAQNSMTPTSFYLRDRGIVPGQLVINETLMNGALKRNSSYVIVISAYTHTEKDKLLYTHSTPSEILSFALPPYSMENGLEATQSTTEEEASFSERYGQKVLYFTISALPIGIILVLIGVCFICRKMRSMKLKSAREKLYGPVRVIRTKPSTPNLSPSSPSCNIKATSSPHLSPYLSQSSRPLTLYSSPSLNLVRSPYPPPSLEPPPSLRPHPFRRSPLYSKVNCTSQAVNLSNHSLISSSRPECVPPLPLDVVDPVSPLVSPLSQSLAPASPYLALLSQLLSPSSHTLAPVSLPVSLSFSPISSPLGPISPSLFPMLPPPISPSLLPPPMVSHPLVTMVTPDSSPLTQSDRYTPFIVYSHSSPSVIPPPHPPPLLGASWSVPSVSSSSASVVMTTPALFAKCLLLEDSGLMIDQAPELELQFSEFNLYPFSRKSSPIILPSLSSSYFLAPLIPSEYSSAYVTANTSPESSFFLAPEEPMDGGGHMYTSCCQVREVYCTPPQSPSPPLQQMKDFIDSNKDSILKQRIQHRRYKQLQCTNSLPSINISTNREQQTSIVNPSALKWILTNSRQL